MRTYCEECGKEVNTKIVIKNEVYNVLGENIEVEAKVLTCAECGEELFDEALDNQTLLNAYNEYQRRHNIMGPLSRPLPKILRVPSDRTVLSSEAPKVELIRNLIA